MIASCFNNGFALASLDEYAANSSGCKNIGSSEEATSRDRRHLFQGDRSRTQPCFQPGQHTTSPKSCHSCLGYLGSWKDTACRSQARWRQPRGGRPRESRHSMFARAGIGLYMCIASWLLLDPPGDLERCLGETSELANHLPRKHS
jgi:hypothetical protein